jgi:ABC-type polar amino acid transport system ATPase subunit
VSPLLEARGITKRFPGVVALDGVNFELEKGEVHVLLGENGAGKSTLIKMLSGAYQPDEGDILLDGEQVNISSGAVAQDLGISTIYQEFNLVPQLTVAENIFLGRQPRRFGLVDRRGMVEEARELLERMRVRVDPKALVSDLGVAQRQMIEIAKALRGCADRNAMRPCGKRARDARSFGELPSFPNDTRSLFPCPHSHHTSSSPSSKTSRPSYPNQRSITRWALTPRAYQSG